MTTAVPAGTSNAGLLLYNVGTDGVDVVRGFEVGLDVLRITLNDGSLDMQEVADVTWVGFAEDAGGGQRLLPAASLFC